jgi:hypothetical protein
MTFFTNFLRHRSVCPHQSRKLRLPPCKKSGAWAPLQSPMPFVDVEGTNFTPYPIHRPVACGGDSGDRAGQGQRLALQGRILRFSLGQNLRVGQGSRPNWHGLRPGMTRPSATFRGLAPSSARVSKPGAASLQRSAILGASSQRLEFEPPHASSLDVTETRGRVRSRTMACRYRARISREGNSVL